MAVEPDATSDGQPQVDPALRQIPSRAARALAAVLLDNADALDVDDLRAADAMAEIRRSSRVLAEALHDRGWGDVYLGLEVAPDGVEPEDEDEGVPLPAGTRVTYQARFDFVVTDPDALLNYLSERVGREPAQAPVGEFRDIAGQAYTAREPRDEVEAVGTLAYLDGLGSRDYSHVGLEFGGGQEIVRPITEALWELARSEDQFPFE